MGSWKGRLLTYATNMSALAVAVAALLAPTCRHNWYEPKEPKNLKELF